MSATIEAILTQFGDWIHEEQNEDGYGMPASGTYWYCEVCDECHVTPDAIPHRDTCSVGKGVALADELAAVIHAAHMPDDYEFGLPSWINQKLYAAYLEVADARAAAARWEERYLTLEKLVAGLPCLDPVVSSADREITFSCVEWNRLTDLHKKPVCANCRVKEGNNQP